MKKPVLASIVLSMACLTACANQTAPVQATPEVTAAPLPSESAEPDVPKGYTDDELCAMARKYYERRHDFAPPVVVVDSVDGDVVTIHLFEDLEDHVATLDWYTIDRITARGSGMLDGPVDLTE